MDDLSRSLKHNAESELMIALKLPIKIPRSVGKFKRCGVLIYTLKEFCFSGLAPFTK